MQAELERHGIAVQYFATDLSDVNAAIDFHQAVKHQNYYFAPAREGDVILADTTIVKKGRQFINAQFEIWNEKRIRLIARGYSNLLKTNINR